MACLTSKELSALGDQLNFEDILVKKYRSMAGSCTDPQMKNHFQAIAGAHQQHYDKIKTFLSQEGEGMNNNSSWFAGTGLGEKEALGECLMDQKQITSSYNTFAGECTNTQLRDAFLDILRSEHQIQSEIFNVLQSNGWYQTEAAPADKINQLRQQYASQP